MGTRMARKLIDANHVVTVWNRTSERSKPLAEAGAQVAKSPREAATGAEIVIAMVRDDGASRMAWLDAKVGAVHQMALLLSTPQRSPFPGRANLHLR